MRKESLRILLPHFLLLDLSKGRYEVCGSRQWKMRHFSGMISVLQQGRNHSVYNKCTDYVVL